jgi:hypothetical protein
MNVCPPLESNFVVYLEDTPSPPYCLWEFIANNDARLYPNFCQDSSRHYSDMGLQPPPYLPHCLTLEVLTLGSKLWSSNLPPIPPKGGSLALHTCELILSVSDGDIQTAIERVCPH